ncbi:class I SAM-dependent methyltransferase [Gorillibacterium massiliense]|uniref:class I SAM-dependent methyltransferase n=1 Tax=Gorillibacterium massiliense TaxID=1280390 RepID=UPI0004AE66A2|nr:class I SAM-dependent methyltransferase [Gorillibacterium massiliense]
MISSHYEQIAEKFWSLPQKPGEEDNRDRLFMDDQILHAHLEREIESRLKGVKTILDAGGGTGRFSIWLAKMGYQVTHLDLSLPMLERAKSNAKAAGIEGRIAFVHGKLTDLSAYGDNSFDLVISLDAPVSYTWPKHHEVIQELIRIAGIAIVLCVSNRLGGFPGCFNPLRKVPFLLDENDPDSAMQWYVWEKANAENWEPNFAAADHLLTKGMYDDPERTLEEMKNGGTPWPVTYLFRPEEIQEHFQAANLQDIRLAGPGALARTLPGDILRKLLYTEAYREPFLERCYRFDSEPSVCGMGYTSLVVSGGKWKEVPDTP